MCVKVSMLCVGVYVCVCVCVYVCVFAFREPAVESEPYPLDLALELPPVAKPVPTKQDQLLNELIQSKGEFGRETLPHIAHMFGWIQVPSRSHAAQGYSSFRNKTIATTVHDGKPHELTVTSLSCVYDVEQCRQNSRDLLVNDGQLRVRLHKCAASERDKPGAAERRSAMPPHVLYHSRTRQPVSIWADVSGRNANATGQMFISQ